LIPLKPEAWAPVLHESIIVGDEERKIENNVGRVAGKSGGKLGAGIQRSDLVWKRNFQTGRVSHAQMETKSVVCKPEADGGNHRVDTTQTIHNVRHSWDIFSSYPEQGQREANHRGGLSVEHPDELRRPIGGALALKAAPPVKLVSTREEDFYSM